VRNVASQASKEGKELGDESIPDGFYLIGKVEDPQQAWCVHVLCFFQVSFCHCSLYHRNERLQPGKGGALVQLSATAFEAKGRTSSTDTTTFMSCVFEARIVPGAAISCLCCVLDVVCARNFAILLFCCIAILLYCYFAILLIR
jgi:hypothetical protein